MFRLMALGLLVATPLSASGAFAQDTVVDADAQPKKIRSVFVYGNEPCPQADNADEIVVCRRAPAEEQYRIPPPLRETPPNPANTAWTERVESVLEANDANVPGSCSPVGSQGQTGCSRKAAERWAADRRAQGEAARVPLP